MQASINQIANYLIAKYPDKEIGATIIQGFIDDAFNRIRENKVIGTSIEGNNFSWDTDQYSSPEWLEIWQRARDTYLANTSAVEGRSKLFRPRFSNLTH